MTPDRTPSTAIDKVTDLMAALEQSVAKAKKTRRRDPPGHRRCTNPAVDQCVRCALPWPCPTAIERGDA